MSAEQPREVAASSTERCGEGEHLDGPEAKRVQDEHFMAIALEEARQAAAAGEVPVGAVVVHQPYDEATRRFTREACVLARGHNLRETLADPSAHGEFLAMIQATKSLEAWRLEDCTVYVTLEPCIMCAGLMHQSRIRRCVFGAADPKAGALGSLYNIGADERLNHRFEVTAGVLQEECAQVLKEFFRERRAQKKAPSPPVEM